MSQELQGARSRWTQKQKYFSLIILTLSLGLGANSAFFEIREAFGLGGGTFFFDSNDRFADLLKVALSYSGHVTFDEPTDDFTNEWNPLYRNYYFNNPYLSDPTSGGLTNLHMPPVTTLISISSLWCLEHGVHPPVLLLGLYILVLVGAAVAIGSAFSNVRYGLGAVIVIAISYPGLMVFTRANIFALLVAVFMAVFLIRVFRASKIGIFELALLAIAINIRPNVAILLFLSFGYLRPREAIVFLLKVGVLASLFFISALFVVAKLYPAYSFVSFIMGLKIYNALYVDGGWGLAFGSSLVGVANFLHLGGWQAKLLVWVPLGTIAISTIWLSLSKRLPIRELPFIAIAWYAMATPVFADYHLVMFFVPILLITYELPAWNSSRISLLTISIACCLVLIPKNYVFVNGISLQVIVNPLVLVITSFAVLISAIHRPKTSPVSEDVKMAVPRH